MIVAITVSVAVGFALGYFFSKVTNAKVKAGELFFYSGNSEEPPTMAAVLDIPVEELCKHDSVTFEVSRR